MENEELVADIDLVRICQVLTLTQRAFNHCVGSSFKTVTKENIISIILMFTQFP